MKTTEDLNTTLKVAENDYRVLIWWDFCGYAIHILVYSFRVVLSQS